MAEIACLRSNVPTEPTPTTAKTVPSRRRLESWEHPLRAAVLEAGSRREVEQPLLESIDLLWLGATNRDRA